MRPNPQETENLVTFTEKILNWKLDFCTININTKKIWKVNQFKDKIRIYWKPEVLLSSFDSNAVGNIIG